MHYQSYIIKVIIRLNSSTLISYMFAPTLITNFSVAIAILLNLAKLNIILKLELPSIIVCLH